MGRGKRREGEGVDVGEGEDGGEGEGEGKGEGEGEGKGEEVVGRDSSRVSSLVEEVCEKSGGEEIPMGTSVVVSGNSMA